MGNEIVSWQEELKKHAKSGAALERPAVSRLSLKGGAITYMGQMLQQNFLDVVVVGYIFERRMYEGRYNPSKPAAPLCFSFSETGEGMVPHEKVLTPQAETCEVCLKAAWGSDTNSPSKKGQACKDTRKLALLSASDVLDPDRIKKAELAIVDVPVTSVSNWRNYVNNLSGAEELPPFGAVTRITVKPHPKYQIQVLFDFVRPLEHALIEAVFERRQRANDVLMVPYVRNADGSLSEETEAMMTGKKY